MNRPLKKSTVAYINLAFCILLWASIPIAAKKMLVELNDLQVLFYSTVISTLTMGLLLVLQGRQKEMHRYGCRDYLNMGWLGFLGNYLYYVFLYGALARTSASEGFILAYTWPMLVLLLSFIFLKEKVTVKKISGIIISFIGIIVITSKGNPAAFSSTSIPGDLLALAGAFVFALFSVLGKKYNYDKTISVFIYFLSAAVFLVPTMLLLSSFRLPDMTTWLWLLYNGALVNGVSYIFWFKALEYGQTHVISNLIYLTPFISLLYIVLILKEPILFSSLAGLLLIVSGILAQFIGGKKLREQ